MDRGARAYSDLEDNSPKTTVVEESIAFCCEFLIKGCEWSKIMDTVPKTLYAYASASDVRRFMPT